MAGTAVLINAGTQISIANDSVGGTMYQTVKLDMGAPGASNPFSGTIPAISNLAGGTISSDTIIGGTLQQLNNLGTLPNLPGGSIAVTSIPNITNGTMNLIGTVNAIGTFPNLPGGTLNAGTVQVSGGTLGILTNGTLSSSGTSTGVGVLSMLSAGTISMINAGTITSSGTTTGVGVLSMLSAGTITSVGTNVGIGTVTNLGTLTNVGVLWAGTVQAKGGTIGVVSMLSAGTVSMINAGTITSSGTTTGVGSVSSLGSMAMLTAGTISMINNGTLASSGTSTGVGTISNIGSLGVLNAGTVNINPFQVTQTIMSVGTTGTVAIGTLSTAIGAGTGMYITRFSILAISGTPECILAFGSQTANNQVIAHGVFPAGGGMVSDITVADHFGTNNLPLTYQILSGAGTVDWRATYFAGTA